jgi:hypothetical protein
MLHDRRRVDADAIVGAVLKFNYRIHAFSIPVTRMARIGSRLEYGLFGFITNSIIVARCIRRLALPLCFIWHFGVTKAAEVTRPACGFPRTSFRGVFAPAKTARAAAGGPDKPEAGLHTGAARSMIIAA